MFSLIKPYLKSFIIRFLLVLALVGSFYYTLYYYAPQKDIIDKSREKLALQNITSKLNQINQTFSDLSQYTVIDENDFIHSMAIYRERAANALALSKEVRDAGEKILKLRPNSISKNLLALALKMPGQTYTLNQVNHQHNYASYMKAQESLNNPEAILNYILENQKALRNLFEYIPELDFRGLSVSNGRSKFADRLNRADIGLTKTIKTLNSLQKNIREDDPTLKDVIATVSNLKQTSALFKNAVIAGDHVKTESFRANFALQVALAKKNVIKNRIDFLKNYLEQTKIQENLENVELEIKNILINI